MIRTYRDDLSDVERCVATIGFQHDLAIAMFPFPDVCEPPGGHRVPADDLDDLWAEPTTGGWQGRSEALSRLRITLGRGYVVRVWSE